MRDLALKLFKDNAELKNYTAKTAHLQSVAQRRSVVRIAVVDDEAFAPQANLLSYGYRVTPIGDLKRLDEVASYHMVLCDIMGVGKHFDTTLQGASLIAEIKKTYPEKVVVAYTGAAMNEKAARVATARADKILKKDIDIEEWTATLDRLSSDAVDPYIIWNKIRMRFVELGTPTTDILRLEDAYVRSVKNNDSKLSTLSSMASSIVGQQDVRAIIQGLASSEIFEHILGG